MSDTKRAGNGLYIKNALVLMFDTVIKILVGFFLTVLIARAFGPGKFGEVNYVYAVIEILQKKRGFIENDTNLDSKDNRTMILRGKKRTLCVKNCLKWSEKVW